MCELNKQHISLSPQTRSLILPPHSSISPSVSPPRCLVAGLFPVQLAVPPLQRPQLELEGRLLPRWLPHDVRHPPGHVQAGGPAPQRGPDRPVDLSARAGRHHLDLPRHLPTHQPVHQLPGLPLLPRRKPQQRPQAVLLQPLAPAHAAAAGAHLQEASQRSGGSGSTSNFFTSHSAKLTGLIDVPTLLRPWRPLI